MKFKIFLFLGLFSLGVFLPRFMVPNVKADILGQDFTCMEDYYQFILHVSSEKTRSESMKDVFTLGYCQITDIFTLDDELDSVKASFRTAANACQPTNTYKTEYERILMEMYFVRHLQDEGALDAVDEEQLAALKDKQLAILKSDMKSLYVDEEKRVDENTFDSYFETWSIKYEDRIADYRKCEEGPWAEVNTTLTDFVTDIQKFVAGVKNFSVNIDKGKSLKEILIPEVEKNVDEDMTAIGNSIKNAWQYLKGDRQKRDAEVEAPATVSDLGSEGTPLTIDQALESLQNSSSDYTIENRSSARMSRYSLIYGAGGSVQATNLQSLVSQLNAVLEDMNTKDLPSIAGNTAKILDKQCN